METEEQVQPSKWPVQGTLSKNLENAGGSEGQPDAETREPRTRAGVAHVMIWILLLVSCGMVWLWLINSVAAFFKR